MKPRITLCELDHEVRKLTGNILRVIYCHTVGTLGDFFYDTFTDMLEKQIRNPNMKMLVISTYGGYITIEKNPRNGFNEIDSYYISKMKKEDFEILPEGFHLHYISLHGEAIFEEINL